MSVGRYGCATARCGWYVYVAGGRVGITNGLKYQSAERFNVRMRTGWEVLPDMLELRQYAAGCGVNGMRASSVCFVSFVCQKLEGCVWLGVFSGSNGFAFISQILRSSVKILNSLLHIVRCEELKVVELQVEQRKPSEVIFAVLCLLYAALGVFVFMGGRFR